MEIYLLKKQIQFEKWVLNYNDWYKRKIGIKIPIFRPSLDNDWLSGFIDAEGYFGVSVSKKKIIQRFVLGRSKK